ncbi:SDR family oxidoreductase [Nocardia sp. NPDC050799]|uniref:SDR family NAD(P)-dependent oxidoreductase n=1 Tax=Nocardia sp. NPDC050799 TaxID=3154842 RepID=UPI0033C65A74
MRPCDSVSGVALPGLGDDGFEEGCLGGELLEQSGLRDRRPFGNAGEGSAVVTAVQAIEALSRTLAAELGPRGIQVNFIAPGPTATDFNGGAMRDDAEMRRGLAGQTALGRVGEPEEIGDAIATLASEGLRWMTAQRIEVSGGALL